MLLNMKKRFAFLIYSFYISRMKEGFDYFENHMRIFHHLDIMEYKRECSRARGDLKEAEEKMYSIGMNHITGLAPGRTHVLSTRGKLSGVNVKNDIGSYYGGDKRISDLRRDWGWWRGMSDTLILWTAE